MRGRGVEVSETLFYAFWLVTVKVLNSYKRIIMQNREENKYE